MFGLWWIVLAIALTICRASDIPTYPKEYAEYKWDDPEHNRIRKKKMAEWGEELLRQDEEDSFLQMQNEMKASLPKVRLGLSHSLKTYDKDKIHVRNRDVLKSGGVVYMKERTRKKNVC